MLFYISIFSLNNYMIAASQEEGVAAAEVEYGQKAKSELNSLKDKSKKSTDTFVTEEQKITAEYSSKRKSVIAEYKSCIEANTTRLHDIHPDNGKAIYRGIVSRCKEIARRKLEDARNTEAKARQDLFEKFIIEENTSLLAQLEEQAVDRNGVDYKALLCRDILITLKQQASVSEIEAKHKISIAQAIPADQTHTTE